MNPLGDAVRHFKRERLRSRDRGSGKAVGNCAIDTGVGTCSVAHGSNRNRVRGATGEGGKRRNESEAIKKEISRFHGWLDLGMIRAGRDYEEIWRQT